MIRAFVTPVLLSCNASKSYNLNAIRYIRNIGKRGIGPTLVEGKVKTVTKYDNTSRIETYEDLIKDIKDSDLGDELELEKAFAQEDDFGHPLERSNDYFAMHFKEEKAMKSRIKKGIIKRKLFKFDMETNLLTFAAKGQIRFLHKLNPQEWNYKALAECFPITETGVKKLLKSSFIPTYPEKIRAHDEEVSERWKILKSGKATTSIEPLTQKLYKEGKLVDDYFSGNPNLPTVPPTKKVIKIEKRKKNGEFSQIVQTYSDYEKQKLLNNGLENCSENQITLRDNGSVKSRKTDEYQDIKSLKYASKEITRNLFSQNRNHKTDDIDLPLSQFKEILKDEMKSKHGNESECNEVLKEKYAPDTDSSKRSYDNHNCFIKISKYDQNKNINAMFDSDKNMKRVYKYDEKLGYQHPIGKNIKGQIHLSPEQRKKGKLYKVGQCVYDENGEFLYKVPA